MNPEPEESAQLTAAEQEQLSTLFDSHVGRLYRLARRLTPTADDALDLVQETFLKVARSPAIVPEGPRAEEAWLVRVLVNIRRDQWRREAVRRRRIPQEATAAEHPNPERLYVLHVTVWQALDSLSPRRRAILVMHEIEGLSVPSVASLLGITTTTVRWHLARARHELSGIIRLNTEGATNEDSHASLAGGGPAASRGSSQI
jgi:RNA polymerase sigma-70 factor (ECF subfamily)